MAHAILHDKWIHYISYEVYNILVFIVEYKATSLILRWRAFSNFGAKFFIYESIQTELTTYDLYDDRLCIL